MIINKKALSWLALLSGVLCGAFCFAEFGAVEAYPGANNWSLIAAWFAPGSACVAVSCIAIYNRRLGGLVFGAAIPLLVLAGLIHYRLGGLAMATFIFVAPLSLGMFWGLTGRAGWPPVIAESVSRRRKVANGVSIFLATACLTLVGDVVIQMTPATASVDCGRKPPFGASQYKGQTVFVATLHDPGVAVVKELFWGLPARDKFVLIAHWGLRHNVLDGKTYFIDGHRSTGLITRWLPIVEIAHCGRTNPLDRAMLDLRILRGVPGAEGVHLIGQVTGAYHKPRPGVKVVINGPTGTIAITTDEDGIYDAADLQPGHYAVRLAGCDESKNLSYYRCGDSHESELKPGDLWATELRID